VAVLAYCSIKGFDSVRFEIAENFACIHQVHLNRQNFITRVPCLQSIEQRTDLREHCGKRGRRSRCRRYRSRGLVEKVGDCGKDMRSYTCPKTIGRNSYYNNEYKQKSQQQEFPEERTNV
jgi:hypothetical protein